MWDEQLEALLTFRATQGHIDVPRDWPENPVLAHWVINQRRQLRRGTLSPSRLQRLLTLGIRWQTAEERTRDRDRRWNRMCDALHSFLRAYGHCDVPDGWAEHPELSRWVVRQRHLMRVGTLRADRARRFEERGIDWSLERGQSRSRDRAWERLFRALADFRRSTGTCAVPKNWSGDPRLARWVARQRVQLRHARMRPERRARLETLGLRIPPPPPLASGSSRRRRRKPEESRRDRTWNKQFQALVAFRAAHGHCEVPRRFAEDPGLARWVCHQRERRSRGRLPEFLAAKLDQVHFRWSRQGASAPVHSRAAY